MFSNKTIQSLEEKISVLIHKNMELQTSYNNALETVGRMAVHANMLEKELIHMREKYNSLLEQNELFTPFKIYNGTPEGVPLDNQGQQLPINETPLSSNLHRCKTHLGTDEKRSIECSPRTAFEAGHITRQTNALSYMQDEVPVYTTLRRSTRSKR